MRKEGLWRLIGGIERRLGYTLEALFPLKSGLQPLDVVDALERAMADPRHRSPWRDGKVYAPNRYTIHLVCKDEQQRAFLFAFLNDDELRRVVREHAKEEKYQFLTEPEFEIHIYEDAIPGRPEEVICVEPGWAAPEGEPDEHEEPTEPPVRARLVVEEGPDRGLEFVIRDRVAEIGRSRRMSNAVVLSDPHISRRHARLECCADDSMVIENLRGDANPMMVNDQPVVRSPLQFGDRVKLGTTVLVVRPPIAAEGSAAR